MELVNYSKAVIERQLKAPKFFKIVLDAMASVCNHNSTSKYLVMKIIHTYFFIIFFEISSVRALPEIIAKIIVLISFTRGNSLLGR